jgi:GT2 family glycosyltransferase
MLSYGRRRRNFISRKLAYVVVVNWNSWRDTSISLGSTRKLDYPNFKVVVVDNGSTDDSVAKIKEAYPEVTLLETGANLGFSIGNNTGIRHGLAQGAEYVWLLNNDAEADPHALSAMVDLAERDPTIGAVGSLVYHLEDRSKLQAFGGGWANVWTGRSSEHTQRVPTSEVQYITGASLMMTRAALEKSGMLDERFFLYFEDTDLGFRYRRDGWKLAVAEDAKVFHRGNSTSGGQIRSRAKSNAKINRTFGLLHFLSLHSPSFLVSAALSTAMRTGSNLLRRDWGEVRNITVDTGKFLALHWRRVPSGRGAPTT